MLGIVGLATLVHERRGQDAARAWAALTWLLISGRLLVASTEFVSRALPMAPPTLAQMVGYGAGWAVCTGTLAAVLFRLSGRLVRSRAHDLDRAAHGEREN